MVIGQKQSVGGQQDSAPTPLVPVEFDRRQNGPIDRVDRRPDRGNLEKFGRRFPVEANVDPERDLIVALLVPDVDVVEPRFEGRIAGAIDHERLVRQDRHPIVTGIVGAEDRIAPANEEIEVPQR